VRGVAVLTGEGGGGVDCYSALKGGGTIYEEKGFPLGGLAGE